MSAAVSFLLLSLTVAVSAIGNQPRTPFPPRPPPIAKPPMPKSQLAYLACLALNTSTINTQLAKATTVSAASQSVLLA